MSDTKSDLFVVQYRRSASETWRMTRMLFATSELARKWCHSRESGFYSSDVPPQRLREWRIMRVKAEVEQ